MVGRAVYFPLPALPARSLYKTVDPDGPPKDAHDHSTPPRFARLYKASPLAETAAEEAKKALNPESFAASAHGSAVTAYGANFFVQAGYSE